MKSTSFSKLISCDSTAAATVVVAHKEKERERERGVCVCMCVCHILFLSNIFSLE